MKYALTAVLVLTLVGAAPATEAPTKLEYDVTAIKRKLILAAAEGERELAVGDRRFSGDALRTGSRSSADLEVPERAAAFHIGAKTEFRLAHGQPGVLLEIDRGSVRAIFGPLMTGSEEERLVTTPSAVLAVRGTEYGLEVEKDGDTSLTVFEGEVELRALDEHRTVVRVPAGQATRIRMGRQPSKPWAHGMSSRDWDSGRRIGNPSAGGQQQQQPGMGEAGRGGSGGGSRQSSSQGGSKRHGG